MSAKRSRGRQKAHTEAVNVRLDRDQLASIDEFIAGLATRVSRPEAIRKLVSMGLPTTVEVTVSEERHSWGGDAVMTQPKPKGPNQA